MGNVKGGEDTTSSSALGNEITFPDGDAYDLDFKGEEGTASNNLQYAGVGSLDNKDFNLFVDQPLGSKLSKGGWNSDKEIEVSL